MSAMQSRTLNAWCVVNGGGHVFLDTVERRRRDAILAYGETCSSIEWGTDSYAREIYKRDRRKFGVQVVRCTITTEPVKP